MATKTLTEIFNETATAIQAKTGNFNLIPASNFGKEISSIPGKGDLGITALIINSCEDKTTLKCIINGKEYIPQVISEYNISNTLYGKPRIITNISVNAHLEIRLLPNYQSDYAVQINSGNVIYLEYDSETGEYVYGYDISEGSTIIVEEIME